ncbi:MAG: glycosidase [Candidatus Njordarchaeia archaeon]
MRIPKFPSVDAINKKRRFETRDMFKRLGFLKASDIDIGNYPLKPVKAFNSTFLIENDVVVVYPRLIFDYYKYVSSIARLEIDLNTLLNGKLEKIGKILGDIIIFPDRLEDIWGAEDPRVFKLDGKYIIAYTGRTKWYYKEDNDETDYIKTTTILATSEDTQKYTKVGYITFDDEFRNKIDTVKNCIPFKGKKGMYSLCRLHTKTKQFYTVIAQIKDFMENNEFREYVGENVYIGIENADFELKNGWGTPPVKVSNREYLAILHGVDKELYTYRAFAVLLEENKTLEIVAVTPYYILEPKNVEERYGDRPNVVFPCGLQIVDEKLIISYGAADSFIGFAETDVTQLLEILDKNRID